MNYKRAIWISLLVYLASMLLGIILAVIVGIDVVEPTLSLWLWGMAITVLLTFVFTLWYFKKTKGTVQEGLQLGGVMIGIGVVLDVLFTASVGQFDSLIKYYLDPLFFATLILLLITAGLTAKYNLNILKKIKLNL